MDAPRVPSTAADFTMEEATIALPRRNSAGAELVVRIRALPLSVIATEFKGIPSKVTKGEEAIEAAAKADLGPDSTALEPAKLTDEEARARTKRIVQGGTVLPPVAFDDGEPGVPWDGLHYENQQAWMQAILAQSGLAGEDPTGLLSFRVIERGGVAVS